MYRQTLLEMQTSAVFNIYVKGSRINEGVAVQAVKNFLADVNKADPPPFSDVDEMQKEITALKNCPPECQPYYLKLIDIHDSYRKLTRAVYMPTGNIHDYKREITELTDDMEGKRNALSMMIGELQNAEGTK